jgi:hypothetical protein
MTAILRRLPYAIEHVTWRVGAEPVRVKPYQIALWVSVTARGLREPGNAPRLPALLDSANNHNFSIQERHLVHWAGTHPELLRTLNAITERGRHLPLRAADVWIHPNRPGTRESSGLRPYRLNLTQGIAVYPEDGSNFPRLPLLGLRGLTDNKLDLRIDGYRREVSLRTARRWWPFR